METINAKNKAPTARRDQASSQRRTDPNDYRRTRPGSRKIEYQSVRIDRADTAEQDRDSGASSPGGITKRLIAISHNQLAALEARKIELESEVAELEEILHELEELEHLKHLQKHST